MNLNFFMSPTVDNFFIHEVAWVRAWCSKKCLLSLDTEIKGLSTLSMVFPPDLRNDQYYVINRYFIPESVRDHPEYQDHAASGTIAITAGDMFDISSIAWEAEYFTGNRRVVGPLYDRWNISVPSHFEKLVSHRFAQKDRSWKPHRAFGILFPCLSPG